MEKHENEKRKKILWLRDINDTLVEVLEAPCCRTKVIDIVTRETAEQMIHDGLAKWVDGHPIPVYLWTDVKIKKDGKRDAQD